MGKKRFHAKLDECGVYYYVCENGEILAETYGRDDAEDIAKRLNELYDGNIHIKELLDENRQLKQRIKEFENDNFNFSYTKNYREINANKLMVSDKHTKINMNGKIIEITLTPPNTEPYRFRYYITGITWVIQNE